MNKAILTAVAALFCLSANATVDGYTDVAIVVKQIHEVGFEVKKIPMVGCWGIEGQPEFAQFKSEYLALNAGCGDTAKYNINALTCAKSVEAITDENYVVKGAKVDLSSCKLYSPESAGSFVEALTRAVKMNFGADAQLVLLALPQIENRQ